jgi:hypothetical protein
MIPSVRIVRRERSVEREVDLSVLTTGGYEHIIRARHLHICQCIWSECEDGKLAGYLGQGQYNIVDIMLLAANRIWDVDVVFHNGFVLNIIYHPPLSRTYDYVA